MPPLRRPCLAPFARRFAPLRGSSLRFASLGLRDARAPSTRPRFRTLAARCATRGWPPPLRPQPSRSRGWARPAPGAGLPRPAVTPAASTAGLRVELARWRSLASASGVALGVKIGGVLRGVLPRSSALRASGGGARGDAVRGSPPRAQPRLRSALGLRPRLRASFKSAETADFQRRLSVRAFQGHFLGKIGRFWAYGGPRDPILPKKRSSKALQGRLQLAPSVTLRVKLGATCLTAAYLPGADSGPRPAPSRPRGRVRDWGRARWALRGMVSQFSRN